MNYGYVRIQKNAIDREWAIQTQSEQLKAYGAEKIFIETDGSQLQLLLDCLKPNDQVHVLSADRLTRKMGEARKIVEYFSVNEISFYVRGRLVNLEFEKILLKNSILELREQMKILEQMKTTRQKKAGDHAHATQSPALRGENNTSH